jgi:hypothetical chaperone protein
MSTYAVDFGTSNSLLTHVDKGVIMPVPLERNQGLVLRSLLYTPEKNHWFFGQEAIEEYVNHEGEGRFFRSIKKFLPEPSYSGTSVFNRMMNISEMVAVILGEMRKRADAYTKTETVRLVLGRPALYSLEPENDKLAQDRMLKAAEIAGFKEVIFCPEPIAAGLDYQHDGSAEKIVIIADFGGGTSDFTLMKFKGKEYEILGLSGVFIAGDVLDGMMMRDFLAPHFGSLFEYKLPGSSNTLSFPRNLLKKICSSAHITHLREKDTWEFLQHIEKFALSGLDEIRMRQLLTLVESQLGFPLFNEIEKTKIKLSSNDVSTFEYHYPGIDITQDIQKDAYQRSTTPSVDEIMGSMNEVFKQSGLKPSDVDQVCLTGGTSQFPLIRQKLEETFGTERLIDHNIYQSVVNGLAHFASRT